MSSSVSVGIGAGLSTQQDPLQASMRGRPEPRALIGCVPVLGGLSSARSHEGDAALFFARDVCDAGAVGVGCTGIEMFQATVAVFPADTLPPQ